MLLLFIFLWIFLFLFKVVYYLLRCYNLQINGASFNKFCLFEHIIFVFVFWMDLGLFNYSYMEFQDKRISRETGNDQTPFQVILQWKSYIIVKLLLCFVFVFNFNFCSRFLFRFLYFPLLYDSKNTVREKNLFPTFWQN